MNRRTTTSGSAATTSRSHAGSRPSVRSRRLPLSAVRRPGLYLGVATAGALLLNVLVGTGPAAQADTGTPRSVSVAAQLGISSLAAPISGTDLQSLGELTASRSQRETEQAQAAQAQAAADQAELDRRAAAAAAQAAAEAKAAADAQAAAEAKAAADAQAAAQARAAAEAQAAAQRAASATPSSFKDYALKKLGGNSSQMSCLESLWGRESGWNPNAQNRSSTAYGIPQFLDSTWASTGIAKTSDGYRQIDAGLIYIDSRYGSPCGAWAHSQSTGWY